MVTIPLSDADKAAVAAAVGEIERRSSAEIVVVAARASGDYDAAAALAVALAALGGGALAAAIWPALPAWLLLAGQSLLFALLWALHATVGLGHRLTPAPLRLARAKRAAAVEFAKLVDAQTADKRGLLIYLAFAERHLEIVADRGIAAAVPDARWQEIVDGFPAALRDRAFGEALSEVVRRCGELLTAAFPAEPGQRNEMADHVVER